MSLSLRMVILRVLALGLAAAGVFVSPNASAGFLIPRDALTGRAPLLAPSRQALAPRGSYYVPTGDFAHHPCEFALLKIFDRYENASPLGRLSTFRAVSRSYRSKLWSDFPHYHTALEVIHSQVLRRLKEEMATRHTEDPSEVLTFYELFLRDVRLAATPETRFREGLKTFDVFDDAIWPNEIMQRVKLLHPDSLPFSPEILFAWLESQERVMPALHIPQALANEGFQDHFGNFLFSLGIENYNVDIPDTLDVVSQYPRVFGSSFLFADRAVRSFLTDLPRKTGTIIFKPRRSRDGNIVIAHPAVQLRIFLNKTRDKIEQVEIEFLNESQVLNLLPSPPPAPVKTRALPRALEAHGVDLPISEKDLPHKIGTPIHHLPLEPLVSAKLSRDIRNNLDHLFGKYPAQSALLGVFAQRLVDEPKLAQTHESRTAAFKAVERALQKKNSDPFELLEKHLVLEVTKLKSFPLSEDKSLRTENLPRLEDLLKEKNLVSLPPLFEFDMRRPPLGQPSRQRLVVPQDVLEAVRGIDEGALRHFLELMMKGIGPRYGYAGISLLHANKSGSEYKLKNPHHRTYGPYRIFMTHEGVTWRWVSLKKKRGSRSANTSTLLSQRVP